MVFLRIDPGILPSLIPLFLFSLFVVTCRAEATRSVPEIMITCVRYTCGQMLRKNHKMIKGKGPDSPPAELNLFIS